MIAIRDAVVHAGRARLLDGVSLDVAAGEIVALFGANGAGKSTLLSVIAGDRRLTTGTARLADRDVARLSPRDLAMQRAVLRQHATLAAPYTALEVVQLATPDRALAKRCLADVELAALADRLYPSLSGGEQQRVQLARILAQQTPLILLDEPTAALDLRQQRVVADVVRRANRTVVIVAHDPAFLARAADRVVVMRTGRIVAAGPPSTTDYDAAFT